MAKAYTIQLKRVYEKKEKSDGFRILVDRLWPRGLSKEKVKVDLWLKDVAPRNELRLWFGHDSTKWDAFQKRYEKELKINKEAFDTLKEKVEQKKMVTLVFSASDIKHNNAIVLRNLLSRVLDRRSQ